MVKIIDFKQRQNEEGEPFNALILQGEIDIVVSEKTGQHYATARRTSIPSTFDEQECQDLLGKELPGSIRKVLCEPYQYQLPESDEVITLNHTYEYSPKPSSLEEHVFASEQGNGEVLDTVEA